ncbi:MAG: hypothetical protein JWO32_2654 [Bacteroidetes bacterium]|nr:hypothetical protein [Bacteroidota bacterium]
MIKQLLSILAVASVVTVSAQTNGKRVNTTINMGVAPEMGKSLTYKTTANFCDTIATVQNGSVSLATAGSDTATPGCSPAAGYVYGTNCYGDLEKANFFPVATYSAINSPSITGVTVGFFKNATRGTGGTATSTVALKIYNGALATGPTTAVVASTVATMAQILSAVAGTSTIIYYTFDFATPVAASATNGFFVSVTLPQGNGDTAVVYNSPNSTIDYGYEKWSDNSWNKISTAWGANTKANLIMFPKVCGTSAAAGISTNSGLSKNISIMPNPSTGLVKMVVSFGTSENLNVTVTNALGQQILSNKYNGISNESIGLDLTSQSNGVYFITISNGTDKMVQRLILNK